MGLAAAQAAQKRQEPPHGRTEKLAAAQAAQKSAVP